MKEKVTPPGEPISKSPEPLTPGELEEEKEKKAVSSGSEGEHRRATNERLDQVEVMLGELLEDDPEAGGEAPGSDRRLGVDCGAENESWFERLQKGLKGT